MALALVPLPYTLYAVLGFLEEYIGRTVTPEGDLVEHFWVNEIQAADLFEQYLIRLVEQYSLQTTLQREVSQGHTYFLSTEISQLINSFYLEHGLTGTDADGNPAYTTGRGFFQQNTGKIAASVFPVGDREAKLAYLSGAHYRYGKENKFAFANAYHKAQLVYQLLQDLGSPQVIFFDTDPEVVPAYFRVEFEPTTELRAWLGLRKLKRSFKQR